MVVDHVEPLAIANCLAARLQRIDAVLSQPFVDIEAEVLLGPQHSRQRLPHDTALVFGQPWSGMTLW